MQYNCTVALYSKTALGTFHKHLLRGADAKRGPLKFLTLVRGALKKNSINFLVKIEFACFSMGSTRNLYGKKGGWNSLRSERGPRKKFRDFFFLASCSSPLTSVCGRSLRYRNVILVSYFSFLDIIVFDLLRITLAIKRRTVWQPKSKCIFLEKQSWITLKRII